MTTQYPISNTERPMSRERRKAGMRMDDEIAIVEQADDPDAP